jgi:hypothetical protein
MLDSLSLPNAFHEQLSAAKNAQLGAVNAWGFTWYLKPWGFDTLAEFQTVAKDKPECLPGWVAIKSLCDLDGILQFDHSHLGQLMALPWQGLQAIGDAVLELNGIGKTAETAEKKST